MRKESFANKVFLSAWPCNYAYGKLRKPNEEAAKNYRKFLGSFIAKTIIKELPGLMEPAYAPTIDYVRTGNTVRLLAG